MDARLAYNLDPRRPNRLSITVPGATRTRLRHRVKPARREMFARATHVAKRKGATP